MGAKRILIVDDHRLLAETLRAMIFDFATSDGDRAVTVDAVTSGRRAAAMLESDEGYDLVLCDLAMPGVDGLTLYSSLVARGSALARRFVLVTGGAFTPATAEAIARHGVPYLTKPFDAPALATVLRSFV